MQYSKKYSWTDETSGKVDTLLVTSEINHQLKLRLESNPTQIVQITQALEDLGYHCESVTEARTYHSVIILDDFWVFEPDVTAAYISEHLGTKKTVSYVWIAKRYGEVAWVQLSERQLDFSVSKRVLPNLAEQVKKLKYIGYMSIPLRDQGDVRSFYVYKPELSACNWQLRFLNIVNSWFQQAGIA